MLGVFFITIGLALAVWGIKASFESPRRRAVVGAVLAPLGILLAALGSVLACVPAFFTG